MWFLSRVPCPKSWYLSFTSYKMELVTAALPSSQTVLFVFGEDSVKYKNPQRNAIQ